MNGPTAGPELTGLIGNPFHMEINMALPLIVGGGNVAASIIRTGGPKFLQSMATWLQTSAIPKSVLEVAKTNPATFMLASKEVADQLGIAELTDIIGEVISSSDTDLVTDAISEGHPSTSSLRTSLVSSQPQEVVTAHCIVAESERVALDFASHLDALEDDFRLISRAASSVGGIETLIALRCAMALPTATIDAYNKYRVSCY